ncbi:hypothetical protein [Arenibacter sp. F20364]|uniref:hypothetical protein n=1 Tax=Arenibacter sp. F20364 TaxID=2926415 RepID=UPI001FF5B300|nr:hypothetical protein [Arenibacter sp. F20364]MCK0191377.1 hypothetical protein [Arenibacter sp. F20364]
MNLLGIMAAKLFGSSFNYIGTKTETLFFLIINLKDRMAFKKEQWTEQHPNAFFLNRTHNVFRQ